MIHGLPVARLAACALLLLVAAAPVAASQHANDPDPTMREILGLDWQVGPAEGRIGTVATITIPADQAFLDARNTRRFLELNQNPPRDDHYTLAARDLSWFAVFAFEDIGYVRDDEKLDADALLASLKASDEPGNKERTRLGMGPLYTVGWHVPPRYDETSRRLEWGLRLRADDNRSIVNYTIRLLGRRGVMHATLVSDPESLDRDIAAFKGTLAGYRFVPGERYAEFREGDRVAEIGLAALVLGGAAAVATKSGFGKALVKLIVVGAVAIGSAVAAFVRRFRRA